MPKYQSNRLLIIVLFVVTLTAFGTGYLIGKGQKTEAPAPIVDILDSNSPVVVQKSALLKGRVVGVDDTRVVLGSLTSDRLEDQISVTVERDTVVQQMTAQSDGSSRLQEVPVTALAIGSKVEVTMASRTTGELYPSKIINWPL